MERHYYWNRALVRIEKLSTEIYRRSGEFRGDSRSGHSERESFTFSSIEWHKEKIISIRISNLFEFFKPFEVTKSESPASRN